MSIDKEKIKDIPDSPGVYFFVGGKRILYIGKATSLRDRVRSYLSGDIIESRGPLVVKMLEEADGVEYQETDSVLDALILESSLIKKKQPPYNSKEKSDTSFYYVVITKEDYPRVFTLRGRDLQELHDPDEFKYVFGPFPHGSQLREGLKIIRRIFPFRGEKDDTEIKARKSGLNKEIGLVPDFENVGRREYGRTIQHIRLFFDGKKGKLIKELQRQMKSLAKEKKFEEAESVKRQVFALEHIRDVSLIKEEMAHEGVRIEAYDVAHTQGAETVGVMTVLEDGRPKKSDYRKFKLTGEGGDVGGLREMLERRFQHDEWQLPRMVVVDGSKAQINTAEAVLDEFGYQIPVVAVTKDERHQPQRVQGDRELVGKYERDIIIANSEAHRFALSFHRQRRGRI